jgi:hypothetical protein
VVARRLDLPVARVRRAEHRGLRALRRSGRDGCAAVSDGAGPDPGTAAAAAGGASLGATVLAGDRSGGGGDQDGGSGGGRDAADGGSRDGSSGGGSANNGDGSAKNGGGASGGVQGISATKPGPVNAATDLTLPLLALVLIGLTALGVRSIRRSRPD